MKIIYFAGGCFWGVQRFFDQFDGVLETTVGYANGKTANPTYQDVKSQESGHSETVKIVYDESKVSLVELLKYFYMIIDPLSLNKQGEDEGISYRTGIYYTDVKELEMIQSFNNDMQKNYDKPIVVEVLPLEHFYDAEKNVSFSSSSSNFSDKSITISPFISLLFIINRLISVKRTKRKSSIRGLITEIATNVPSLTIIAPFGIIKTAFSEIYSGV